MVSVSEPPFLTVIIIIGYLPRDALPWLLARIILALALALALALVRYCIRPGLTISRDAFSLSFCTAKLRRAAKSPVASDLSSVTPSQSASQIFLPGSDSSADPSNRPVFEEPAGSFSIDLPAAHSIDDHGAVHDNIPSSHRVGGDVRQKAESSDSDGGGEVEVHKNKPFAHTPRDASRTVSEKRYMHTRHPSTSTTIKPASLLRVAPPHQSNIRLHKSKPVSDLGPSSTFKPGEAVGIPYSRTATSSGSLLGTITGLFKGKRASVEYNAVYTGPTAVSFANGWSTRTDRNLVRSRVQLDSSEENLPSTVKRRSRLSGGEEELTPKPGHMARSPNKGKGRAASMPIPSSTSAAIYTSKMSLERSSSSTRSRETAANTALNARTNGGEVSQNEVHAPVGRSESKRSATSSGTTSRRRRELQPNSSLNMGEMTRQRGGGRSNGDGSGGGGGLVLPPANFEIVRAPPSVTQAPVLTSPSPSPLVLPSTRRAISGPGSRGAPSPPPKDGTRASGVSYVPAPTSPRRGAPFTKTANGGSPKPLKPALRVSSLSPSPSPAPAVHGSVSSSTPPSIRTPTMPTGAIRLPEIHVPIPRPLPAASMPLGGLPLRAPLSDIPASHRMSILSENEYESCLEDFVDAEDGTEFDTPPAAPTPPLPAYEKPAQSQSQSPQTQSPQTQSTPNGEPQKFLSPLRTLANGSPPVDASVSSTSTAQRKSVRMIIHPTVTVSAPEEYTDPPTPPAYDKEKEYEWYKSHSRSTSGSGTSQRSEVSRGAVPSAWETRVEHQRSVWENSEPEDEGYRAAKSALQRASAL